MATTSFGPSPQVEQALHAELEALDTILDIDAKLSAIHEPHRVLECILQEGLKIIGGDRGEIWTYNAQFDELELACAQGALAECLPARRLANVGISGRAIRNKQPQMVPDIQEDQDYLKLCEQHPADTPYGAFLRGCRSTVQIPLLANGSVIGLFCATSPSINNFPESAMKLLAVLLQRATWVFRGAMSHDQSLTAAWQRAADIAAALGIGELLATGTPIIELRRLIGNASARKALEVTRGRIASLRLRDTEKERLWFAGTAGEGWTSELIQTIYRPDEPSAANQVLTTKERCIIPDTGTNSEVSFKRLFPWIRAHIAVPVFDRQEEVIGILSVNDDHPRDFSREELLSLEHIAQTTALVLEQVEFIRHISLHNLAHGLATPKNLAELCNKVLQEVCSSLPAIAGSLFIRDPQVGDYVLQATTGLASTPVGERIAYGVGEGLTGWIAEYKRALRLRDCTDHAELQRIAPTLYRKHKFAESVRETPQPARYLGVPLLAGNEVIGVMRVVCREGNQEFTETDEQWLCAAAGHIALAIERLWLQEERQQRLAELTLLSEISKKIAQSANRDEILRAILHEGLARLGCTSGHIRLRVEGSDRLHLYDTFGQSQGKSPAPVRRVGEGEGERGSGWVAQHKRPWHNDLYTRVCVPLMVDNHIFGTLTARKDNVPGFSLIQLHVLESLAAMAASAVRTSWLLEGLASTARAMIDVTSMEDLYKRLYAQIKRLMPADVFYVGLYNEIHQQWSFPYILHQDKRQSDAEFIEHVEGEDLRSVMLREKRPQRLLRCPKAHKKAQLDSSDRDQTPSPSVSLLLAPIVFPGDKVLGVLSVQSDVPKVYTSEHEHLLAMIASQASGAIQGAQQLQQARQFEKIRERINLAGATQDFQGLLQTVLENVRELLHCPDALIRLVDERNAQLILAASSGNNKLHPLTWPLEAGITGEAVTSRQTVWAQDVHKNERFQKWRDGDGGITDRNFLDSLEAMIAVPLIAQGKAIGLLAAYNKRDAFCEEDKLNLEEVANVATLPIRHAMLNAQARLLEEMTEHFQKLLKKSGDEEAMLHEALLYAQKLTGCRAGHISAFEDGTQWLVRKVEVGDYLHKLPKRQRSDIGITKRVLAQSHAQLVKGLQQDEDFKPYRAYLEATCPDTPSEMTELNNLLIVPLSLEDIPYGVLSLHEPERNDFTSVQMVMMDKLSQFIGTLLVQARKAQQLQQLARLAGLGELAGFVAHEINTPLGIILMKAELLRDETADAQQQKECQDIMHEAKRGGRIVDELLHYVRRQHTQDKGCDLNAALTNALELIGSLLYRQHIQTQYTPQRLPRLAIEESAVKQIFFNLARNAVDAMPRGGTLTVQTRLASTGKQVELQVSDTGEGIPAALHEQIFHPYFTTKVQGTGMGLSLCRTLAHKYGGDIMVDSTEGQGTTFIVTFPIEEPEGHDKDYSC